MINCILPKRGIDAWGSGAFGASRGDHKHKGIDYACYPGTEIKSPVVGTVTKVGYAYNDDLTYRYVQITTRNRYNHRLFYVSPCVEVGDKVMKYDIIGKSQDIAVRYTTPEKVMKNHIHYEVLAAKTPVDPEKI